MAKEKKQAVSVSKKETQTIQSSGDDHLQQRAQDAAHLGSIDKIRDIIFGNQMRDYDTRFEDLEKYLKNEIKQLNDEAVQRYESLERLIVTEVKALGDRLLQEQKARLSQVEKLEHSQNKEAEELQQLVHTEIDSLSMEMQKRYTEQNGNLAREVGSLRRDKIERIAFAELLEEMARRLSDDIADK